MRTELVRSWAVRLLLALPPLLAALYAGGVMLAPERACSGVFECAAERGETSRRTMSTQVVTRVSGP